MPPDLRAPVSPHFTWLEALGTTHREFLAQQYDPSGEVVVNLERLCGDLLEDIRIELGPMQATSMYRCPGLNAAIGGAKTSAHMDGRACDFHPLRCSEVEAMERIAARVPWALDKAILEVLHGGCWIHVQIAKRGEAPKRVLLMTFDGANYPAFDLDDPRVKALRRAK